MSINDSVITLLIEVFQFQNKGFQFSTDTPLLGSIPEFDSMAVVSIITALENRFGFIVDDDEIDASIFATVGSLVAFVEQKLA
ncbi:MAG: phosphopantetheine-binding protein [Methylovulum sp.]|uniref:acyl carrier protein n=1 Tax=Methylovulum sp. TaxID=1916980 RepID=UPI00261DCAFA|nr:phosphopantetheine-binding protein [Methylovulum sp.]MDD2725079.1 phosphopantetheine-binding protein [Methylovulum sp.]